MTMKMVLGIALECSPTECRVQLLNDGGIILAHYSAPVRKRIQTQSGQLVAVDMNPAMPEVVYRWLSGTVRELKGNLVVVDDQHCNLIEAVSAEGLEFVPQVGDWVFVSFGYSSQREISDLAIDGRPAHPVYLSNYAFPKIEELY